MAAVHVRRYQVIATLRSNVVDWAIELETDDQRRYELVITDGAEVPLLLDLLRHDETVQFDPVTGRLIAGPFFPGVRK
jgi:hypothetical protein